MPLPLSRFDTSRQFFWSGLVAMAIFVLSAWVAFRWEYAWVAAGLAMATCILLFLAALLPTIEIHDSHLRVGRTLVPWGQIRRLDAIRQLPLVVKVTQTDRSEKFLLYCGDATSAQDLLRQVRRFASQALIDGLPYRQFWGEPEPRVVERRQPPPPRYPLLLADDEAEVERMFQRLKTVGHLDQKSSEDK